MRVYATYLVASIVVAAAASGCRGGAQPSARSGAEPLVQAGVAVQATPRGALLLCRRLALVRNTCPRRVPVGPYAQAKRPVGFRGPASGGAVAICSDSGQRGVLVTSSACVSQTWMLEAGAPAGLPLDAPPGTPGKRLGAGRRTRPPQYVHVVIYAARGSLDTKFPFRWPRGQIATVSDALVREQRIKAVVLGTRDRSGHRGALLLAPPLTFGGETGDHLIFRWKDGGVDHAVSIHSWVPLVEAISSLESLVGSAH